MSTVAVARFSSDDRAVSNALPVLWVTSCFHIIGQAKATPVGRILKVIHQGAAPGGKSDSRIVLFVFYDIDVQMSFPARSEE